MRSHWRAALPLVRVLGLSLIAVACASTGGGSRPEGAGSLLSARSDACSLLSKSEIEEVQGGAFQKAVPSGTPGAAITVTQCFFQVEPYSSSVSLTLTYANGEEGRRKLSEGWERIFHAERREARKEEGESGRQEREKAESEREREEEARKAARTPVAGLGQEAFISAGRGNVSLYVLTRDAYVRISVGGRGKFDDWSRQAQTLARAALRRL
ncbi:MAG TPA: hypothetical protein VHQ90_00340 [Thermoanaerobaculia bacterium]|nr:hypothetical protein [Thermoanaerobaculia bacterium]